MTSDGDLSPARRRAWWCVLRGTSGLAALAFVYWFTHEPAPGIRVTWKADVTLEQQAGLERKYLPANRRAPHPEQPRL